MTDWLRIAFVATTLLAATGARAGDEPRLALLIGNADYQDSIGALKNPLKDIALVAKALEALKFQVTTVENADYRRADTAIKRHIQAVRRAGSGAISLLYYSGHGAADPDTRINYLIPVDVNSADDSDVWTNSLDLNAIVEALRAQAGNATHYVVFDACRNELKLKRKGQKALTDKGFQPIAYSPGVMVAYATAPGFTASDGSGDGGPYARALAEELIKPGVEALTMFRNVALRVNREIGQDPWLSASTLPVFYFAGEQASAAAVPTSAAPARGGRRQQIVAMLDTCVTATRHPDGAGIVRKLAARFEGDTYGYGWVSGNGADRPHTIVNVEARDDEFRLSYDYEEGRLFLIPVIKAGAARGAAPGTTLQGIWLQNNGASCLELVMDNLSGDGEGLSAATGSTTLSNRVTLKRVGQAAPNSGKPAPPQ